MTTLADTPLGALGAAEDGVGVDVKVAAGLPCPETAPPPSWAHAASTPASAIAPTSATPAQRVAVATSSAMRFRARSGIMRVVYTAAP